MKDIKSLFGVFRKLNYLLNHKQKIEFCKTFIWMLIGSVFELIGVSAIFPFIQIMMNVEEFRETLWFSILFSRFDSITNVEMIIVVGLIFIIIYILKNLILIYSAYVQTKYSAGVQRELSVDMFSSYIGRSYEFFLDTNSGDIVCGVTTDISAIYTILQSVLSMMSEVLMVSLLTVYLIIMDWQIAVGAIIIMSCCFTFVTYTFKKRAKRAGVEYRRASVEINKSVIESVNGIKDIIVMDRQESVVRDFCSHAKLKENAAIVEGMLSACPERMIEGICISGFMAIMCIKLVIGVDINVFIPVIGSFAMGAFKILPSIAKISTRLTNIVYKIPSLNNVCKNVKEIISEQEQSLGFNYNKDDNKEKLELQNAIVLKDISWHYQNSDKDIISRLNMCINKGDSVAFIGTSGAGKTTLADIILGLLHPQKGCVMMDDIDIVKIPHTWARTVGYVPQTVFLIDGTIRYNVAFGLSDEEMDDEKIWRALEKAQLKDFISNLPNGLDTIVGERGVKISGGQRQRVAIARALYNDPEILVLDEATSALDTETEDAVMDAIESLHGHKTLIIVAHRLTTIRKCDIIYEVKNGIVEKREKDAIL